MSTKYLAARTHFMESPDFRESANPSTLGALLAPANRYLENRLINAFEAGWNAAMAAQQSKPGSQP